MKFFDILEAGRLMSQEYGRTEAQAIAAYVTRVQRPASDCRLFTAVRSTPLRLVLR